jgi:LacI family transcriptional regulator
MSKAGSRRYKKTTVKDIARASGVSVATVSRVLSMGNYPVSPEIRTMVLRVAGEMNYKPSLVYRSRKNFENEIAILIPTFSNPFFTSIIVGFETMSVKEGFHTLVYDVNSWLVNANSHILLYSILEKNVKGILIASPAMYPVVEEFRDDLVSRNVKAVMTDCPKPSSFFNSVYYDYKKGSFMATEYLINQGHQKIVYAGLKLEWESQELRVQGFLEALRTHEIPGGEDRLLILSSKDSDENVQIESGEELAHRVLGLKERPTAVVVMTDIVAFGMFRGFYRLDIKIPDEFSIIGFDDSIFCEMSYPALTTVKVQSEQMGHMSAMLLFNAISGISHNPVGLSLEPCIVKWDSVIKIR